MRKQELWVTLLSISVLAFMAGMAAGILLLQQCLYLYGLCGRAYFASDIDEICLTHQLVD